MSSTAPVLLSLDTATDRIHAALTVGDAARVLDLPGGALASATLLPALAGLLNQAALTWADVDAVGFGCGPGAFTGLRTACSVAQGLALGLDCPVIAIDTLMAVAEDARLASPQAWSAGDTIWVLQDARMDELYVGAFAWDGQRWQVTQPAQLWATNGPAQRWAPDGVLADQALRWAGNAASAYSDLLAALVSAQVGGTTGADAARATATATATAPAPASASASPPMLTPAAPRGRALASLARAAWSRGDTLDAALALPRYVRDKVAQTTAERQVVAQAKAEQAQAKASS